MEVINQCYNNIIFLESTFYVNWYMNIVWKLDSDIFMTMVIEREVILLGMLIS